MAKNPFRYFKNSPGIIQLAVLMYIRFPLSLRNVEALLHERGIDVCHESVRLRVDRFGTYFAHKIRKRRSESIRRSPQWHLDEDFVNIRGERHYLWRAVDHGGEVLEAYVTKKRAENSHLPFRRRERAMSRFRRMRSLQKFVSIHSSVRNHFSHQRYIEGRAWFTSLRDAALLEWQELIAT